MKKIIMTLLVFVFMTTLMFAQWDIEEGFEGATFPPTGWSVVNGGGGVTWVRATSVGYSHTGTAYAYLSDGFGPADDWLITSQVSIQSGDKLTFWARMSYITENFNVKLSTTGNAVSDFTVTLGSETITSATYIQYEYDLSSYTGNVYLAIQGVTSTSYQLFVDDVKVGQEPGSPPDTPVATAATTNGTLTFYANWNASTGATGYYLDVATDLGFTAFLSGYNNLDVGNVTTYSVTALSAVDHYYRLRAYNASGTSGNSNIIGVSGSTLPVNLSTFTAQFINNTPTLYWETQSETDNMGWFVYRNTENDFASAIRANTELIPGHGTTSQMQNYIYEDGNLVYENTTYWYWLESIDYSGLTTIYEPTTLTVPEGSGEPQPPEIPYEYGLKNYPNPFNPSTSISFTLQEDSDVELIIYNVKGEKIKTIMNDHVVADQNITTLWDGKDDIGKQVPSGIYFYQLNTENYSEVKKMMIQ